MSFHESRLFRLLQIRRIGTRRPQGAVLLPMSQPPEKTSKRKDRLRHGFAAADRRLVL